MGRLDAPWTAEDGAERDAIMARAKAGGITQREIAIASGMPAVAGQSRISRWVRGEAHLTLEQLERIRQHLDAHAKIPLPLGQRAAPGVDAGDSEPAADGDDARAMRTALRELAKYAATKNKAEKDELRARLAPHRQAVVGALMRLVVGAKSESVRLRAIEDFLSYSDGKPIQRIMEMGEDKPANEHEVLEKLRRIAARLHEDGLNREAPDGGTASEQPKPD